MTAKSRRKPQEPVERQRPTSVPKSNVEKCELQVASAEQSEQLCLKHPNLADLSDCFLNFFTRVDSNNEKINWTTDGTLRLRVAWPQEIPAKSKSHIVDWLIDTVNRSFDHPAATIRMDHSGVKVSAKFSPAAKNETARQRSKQKPLANETELGRTQRASSSTKTPQDSLDYSITPARLQHIKSSAKSLKDAVDQAVKSLENGEGFDKACDTCSTATKGFMAQILQERIRQFCAGMTDASRPSEFKQTVDLEGKRAFTEQIRSWLMPFNLGFGDEHGLRAYQIHAGTGGAGGSGSLRLREYGVSSSRILTEWKMICDFLTNPKLVDTTSYTSKSVGR